ncbi:11323_t:CDS:2 [Funneliformis caledonium]|uniref:11323_t:CDS:1 n=1 Tax=Funneliformis caledonium TaxID=1117310 RepID=A0A9N8V5M3_9GLOM|nr:11323_t:CDS:2 [Funneliformis caledonium]
MNFKYYQKLSLDLAELYEDDAFCDVIIEAGHAPNNKIFRAHSLILNYRSSYFRRKLSQESANGRIEFKFNVSCEVIQVMLNQSPLNILPPRRIAASIYNIKNHSRPNSRPNSRPGSRPGSRPNSRSNSRSNSRPSSPLLQSPAYFRIDDIDSELITCENASLIANWIGRQSTYALNYEPNLGPSFGISDLKIEGSNFRNESKCYCLKGCYEKSIRTTSGFFSIEDYEVFQVRKK